MSVSLVVLAGTLFVGCDLDIYDCPESECSHGGVSDCAGSLVMGCEMHEGDPCSYGRLVVEIDCALSGQDCYAGECVFREPCPENTVGVCRNGVAHACTADKIQGTGRSCESRGLDCLTVTDERGWSDAVCALSPVPCESSGSSTECRGNVKVTCERGYPVAEQPCEEPFEVCTEMPGTVYDAGQCGLAESCPADYGTTLCAHDVVYACVGADVPVKQRDCRELHPRPLALIGEA